MWPYKKGLGVQLSYGVNGNGIVESREVNVDEEGDIELHPHVVFPRLRNKGINLHRLKNSKAVLVNQQEDNHWDIDERDYSLAEQISENLEYLTRNGTYVPQDLFKSHAIEGDYLISNEVYDPTYDSLTCTFRIRNHDDVVSKVFVYVTGETGCILNLCEMRMSTHRLFSSKKGTYHGIANIPDLGKPFKVTISEPIKQVGSKEASNALQPFPIIIVRTDHKIFVLTSEPSEKGKKGVNFGLEMIGEIGYGSLKGHEFAHFSFDPYEDFQFSVIDVKGNFGFWEIKYGPRNKSVKRIQLKRNEMEETLPNTSEYSIHDPLELSNWKKIFWGNSNTNILAFSRSSITQFEVDKSAKGERLVTFNTWSTLQDVQYSNNHDFLFVLTSKEIIWFKVGPTLERLLSWKHFLDDNDPSLRISFMETTCDKGETSFLCIIYSAVSPIMTIYNFGIRNEKPHSLKDPYFIERTEDSAINQNNLRGVFITELNADFFGTKDDNDITMESQNAEDAKVYGIFTLNNNLRLTVTCFTDIPGLEMKSKHLLYENRSDLSSSTESLNHINSHRKEKDRYFKRFSKEEFLNFLDTALLGRELTPENDEVKQIQEYAFKLGEATRYLATNKQSTRQNFTSLIDIPDGLPKGITNITEFDSMIEQLGMFYSSKGITVFNLVPAFKEDMLDFIGDTKKNDRSELLSLFEALNEFYQELPANFAESNATKRTAIILYLSLLKLHLSKEEEEIDYERLFNEEYDGASSEIKAVLNSWSEATESTNESETPSSSQFQESLAIMSSMPSIKIMSQMNDNTNVASSQRGSELPSSQIDEPSLRFQTSNSQNTVSRLNSQQTQRSLASQTGSSSQKRMKKKRKRGFA
ncbi:Piso0_003796 [Millerozyma farinosa CBS 7064]|uniref:Piso0_003796 protein n=1 Tax=Pichia sorbitophila (strain ATCC MYA-4447 / BCRC 22081 / CBS 7064 / NBRC 10061 / NRRL Y-12695) TaxID=559304 RepID=G8Y8B8_PICSO|nr:Piso0_003796 [Millerozyma farinosa CBS 7064]CCE84255.1 Piso0_003796 [Millerozyma farinosa CBS 7064]